MRISIVFDTPWADWGPDDHRRQMERELAGKEAHEPEMEYQVAGALLENGHDVQLVGIHADPRVLPDHCEAWKPDVVVNCAESFLGDGALDHVCATLLEVGKYRYTGSSPLALQVTRDKAMSKKILAYHGIKVPAFVMYRTRERVTEPPPLAFPLFVKPLASDASAGIAQASVVSDLPALADRVTFVHERFRQPAIAEQFIQGRELYAGILGNDERLEVLPLTELVFDKEKNEPEERIATQAAKWTESYRKRRGIRTVLARPVSAVARERIDATCRAAGKALWLRDYARIDIRLTDDDEVWVLEANANPFISKGHEMANAAAKAGLRYPQFVERIVEEAVARHERT
ncbi:MAG: ATP-grasp domain-containing protein [Gemmatimonadota bacterium]|nr:ATP-grasp domain-containing protein [Gemmatimonadota bacterium]